MPYRFRVAPRLFAAGLASSLVVASTTGCRSGAPMPPTLGPGRWFADPKPLDEPELRPVPSGDAVSSQDAFAAPSLPPSPAPPGRAVVVPPPAPPAAEPTDFDEPETFYGVRPISGEAAASEPTWSTRFRQLFEASDERGPAPGKVRYGSGPKERPPTPPVARTSRGGAQAVTLGRPAFEAESAFDRLVPDETAFGPTVETVPPLTLNTDVVGPSDAMSAASSVRPMLDPLPRIAPGRVTARAEEPDAWPYAPAGLAAAPAPVSSTPVPVASAAGESSPAEPLPEEPRPLFDGPLGPPPQLLDIPRTAETESGPRLFH